MNGWQLNRQEREIHTQLVRLKDLMQQRMTTSQLTTIFHNRILSRTYRDARFRSLPIHNMTTYIEMSPHHHNPSDPVSSRIMAWSSSWHDTILQLNTVFHNGVAMALAERTEMQARASSSSVLPIWRMPHTSLFGREALRCCSLLIHPTHDPTSLSPQVLKSLSPLYTPDSPHPFLQSHKLHQQDILKPKPFLLQP